MTENSDHPSVLASLRTALGDAQVRLDLAERAFFSADLYTTGALCAAVISPTDMAGLSRAVALASAAGYALVPRGAGLSYVGGYTPPHTKTILVDMSSMNHILEVNADDMYITVEGGVTWQQIHEVLDPMGLRLPFIGPFSGSVATVGSGLSNGALFFGSGRYGSAAEIVLGLEVVIADGSVIRTGQASIAKSAKPFYRTYGPDLTGLFVHDAGALGIKAIASLRLMRAQPHIDYLSVGFTRAEDAMSALSDIARGDLVEEAYIMDQIKTRQALAAGSLSTDVKALLSVIRQEHGLLGGLLSGIKLVASGKRFADDDFYSLHMVCAGRSAAAVKSDMQACRSIAYRRNGQLLPDSIPRVARAVLFPPLDGLVGPDGERWVALNAKVAHSDAPALHRKADEIIEAYRTRLDALGIVSSRLMSIVSNHCFSYEQVFQWSDSWLPLHRLAPNIQSGKLKEPAANAAATELVMEVRQKIVDLFYGFGAASNQIGRTYPYMKALCPETAAFIRQLKKTLDPASLMNPGALGLE